MPGRSLDVDLSEQLRARKAAAAAPGVARSGEGAQQGSDPRAGAQAAGDAVAAQQRALFRRGRANAGFASNPPSKGEARRWERNTRFAKRVRFWLCGGTNHCFRPARQVPTSRLDRRSERRDTRFLPSGRASGCLHEPHNIKAHREGACSAMHGKSGRAGCRRGLRAGHARADKDAHPLAAQTGVSTFV